MKKVSEIKEEWLHEQINKLKKVGKSKADISRDLGVFPQFLNALVHGKRGITDQFIDKFINTYKVNQFDLPKYNIKETVDTMNEPTLKMICDLASENALLKKENEELKRGDQRDARDARDADFVVAG